MEHTSGSGPVQKRKKVLFIITKSVLGGAQRYVYDLAVALPKDDYDVAVAFGGTGLSGSEPGVLRDMLDGAGIRTIHIPELGRDVAMFSGLVSLINPDAIIRSISRELRTLRALRTLLNNERPDVVHLNSSKVGGLGAVAARMSRIPNIIYTVHGWPFWEKRIWPIRAVLFFLSWLSVMLTHKSICISEHDREALRFLPFAHKKIVVIRNGIRAALNPLTRRAARAALVPSEILDAHQHDLWIVSVAELTTNKNLFRAIDAVRLANDGSVTPRIFYCIIGAGELEQQLADYIETHDLDESVRLLGFVAESRRYLKAFDASLLPSIKEGLPYVILEAGLAGLPVAASKTGGIPEVIEHQKSGLLIEHPKSADDIDAALNTLRDEKLRKRLGNALKKRVEDNYSFEQMREKTFALYSN